VEAIQTKILQEDWEVEPRLQELGLTKEGLLHARDVAVSGSANATAFHAANAAGTYAYHEGTWALRDQFVSDDWSIDRSDGVETIKNDKLKIRVAFSNVDNACNSFHIPKPRTKKGAGAERAVGNDLFGGLPQYAPRPSGDWSFYYLMVVDQSGAAELTRPVVKGGTFIAAIERVYLSTGIANDGIEIDRTSDVAVEFEPEIARK
jgi:hypothetical protein